MKMDLHQLRLFVIYVFCLQLVHETDGWMFQKFKFEWSLTRYCPELSETFSYAYPYTKMPVPECFMPEFYLHTRRFPEGTLFSKDSIPGHMEVPKKTIFIVHGFRDNRHKPWISNMTTALLRLADLNVVVTDWSQGGAQKEFWQYPIAAANARVAGKAVHDLFRRLQRHGLKRRKSHCIGHSLGAHVCGYAGKYRPFGRISGLDPAGPNFEKLPSYARLNRTDGDFVDILHTDGGGEYLEDYGMLEPMGDLDFYANEGKKQPGCLVNKRRRKRDRKATEEFLEKWVGCSHQSAITLYIQSILTKKCVATERCTEASAQSLGPCSSCGSECPLMGYFSAQYRGNHSGLYNIVTPSKDSC